jgi:lipoprotein Spr
MKRITIIAVLVMLGVTSMAQTTKATGGFEDVLTTDTVLNNFMLHWIGKPYKLGGKTEKGIDCSQFNKRLYKDVYSKDLENVAYKQYNQTQRIKRDSLHIGDLIFFRSKASPSGWHTGVFIGNTYFIHAANRFEGVRVSSVDEPRYKKTIRGYGRLPEKPKQ